MGHEPLKLPMNPLNARLPAKESSMKKIPYLMVCLCTANTLFAGVSPYIGVGVGGVAAKDSRFTYSNTLGSESGELHAGNGAVIDAAAGLDFDQVPFRFEAALSVMLNEIDSATLDSAGTVALDNTGKALSCVMFNGYIDIPTGTMIEPYLFAGIGTATVYHSLSDQNVDDRVGAAQVGAGLGFVLTDFFIVDLKYRYFATDDYTVSNGTETLTSDYASNQFILGFRVRF